MEINSNGKIVRAGNIFKCERFCGAIIIKCRHSQSSQSHSEDSIEVNRRQISRLANSDLKHPIAALVQRLIWPSLCYNFNCS